jgi:D-beta-D-heptose 7-phosphate kinase/D-beta-D-heptose 1-phosphate adenosyltransferase
MDRSRYESIIRKLAGHAVVVLGDLMLDEYLYGSTTRISPEAPVMVVDVERQDAVPGGAANVVSNMLAMGATVSVVGVVGDDSGGTILRDALKGRGAGVEGLITDPARRTTRKTRVLADSRQVLRVDREQRNPILDEVAETLLGQLQKALGSAAALVISDYNKGVITPRVGASAVRMAREAGVIVTTNPKPSSVGSLSGAHVMSLNQIEAVAASGDPRFGGDEGLDEAGAALRAQLDVENLVVTRGARGLSIWRRGAAACHLPAHPVEVFDVAGAGDTVISALTLGLAAGLGIEEAAFIANRAAAGVVRQTGVATVTLDQLLDEF